MKKYTKIETPYIRDMDGSKKLIEGEYRSETVNFLSQLPWQFTEKIDGTNIGVVWDGHRISFQGRTEKSQIPAPLVNVLNEKFNNNETEELFEQLFGEKEIIFFGEGYGNKIQKVGNQYLTDRCDFILFDAYMPENDIWLSRGSLESIAKTFNIDIVPIVITDTIDKAVEFIKTQPNSTIGSAKMEGIVGKPLVDLYDRNHNRLIIKIKVNDFI